MRSRVKIAFNNAPLLGMFGGIHSVRNGKVSGYDTTESAGIIQYADDILVHEQGSLQKVAVRDRTPLAHLIAGCTLVAQDSI